jgi:hypothetical protein
MVRIVLAVMAIALSSLDGAAAAAVDLTTRGKLAALAVPFVPNAGQWDSHAAFAAPTFAGTLFVTVDGQLVYRMPGARRPAQTSDQRTAPWAHRVRLSQRTPAWVLTETLVDAAGRAVSAVPRGARPLAGRASYAIGTDESRHRDGLPTYERISLGEVYPGVVIELRATGRNIEKIFAVAPGHDPGAIRIALGGAERLELDAAGALLAHTGNGAVTYTAPVAYQEDAAGERTAVRVRYALDAMTQRYGFALGPYDHQRALIIDPLLQSTYLGGGATDEAFAAAVHPFTGEVYVTGITNSTNFPKVAGAEQTTHAVAGTSPSDVFVTRLNAALTTRLQSTYLGGTGRDEAYALAIHPATGEVYVGGLTTSTDFPKIAGSEQTKNFDDVDGFVTRLNALLTTRLQSTFLGGSGEDAVLALAIHPATGEVYATGYTHSASFPKVAGAEQVTHAGGLADAFVTRLNAALTTRLQSTYLGGGDWDMARALAIHPATGDVYVAGSTQSTGFPKVAGAEQVANGSGSDAFVTRLNATLTSRLQSTYVGGTSDDFANALAIHPQSGEVYVAGFTNSINFPRAAGAEQTALVGTTNDAFVTRLNAALTIRPQSTYLGGNGNDVATALAIHPATGDVYVTGYTTSTNFPKVAGGEQATHAADSANGEDGFVTRLNAALTTRLQSTYLGGNSHDQAYALAIHPATGEVYVAGFASSSDFPKVAGAEQTAKGAGDDAFVSRYSIDLMGADAVPDAFGFAPRINVPVGSQQVSAPAQIAGIVGNVPIYVAGGNFADYCISSGGASCTCDVQAMGNAGSTINNNQYVCIRQNAPFNTPAQVKATLVVGGGLANFLVTTGTEVPALCSLDVDGNAAIDALTDGLMLMRAMYGLTGTAVTDGATDDGAMRTTWAQIQPYLNGNCGANFAQ